MTTESERFATIRDSTARTRGESVLREKLILMSYFLIETYIQHRDKSID